MYRNPVARGLVARPADWAWSGFRHYATGVEGTVEIESSWTAARRDRVAVGTHVSRRGGRDVGHPLSLCNRIPETWGIRIHYKIGFLRCGPSG